MDSVSCETKLHRFLIYGSDSNVYCPGSRLDKSYYTSQNIEKLRLILTNMNKEVVFSMIKWVHEKQLSPYPELIPFVLSECCRKAEWRSDGIKLAELLLKNGKEFLLFFKFAFEITPKLGTGRTITRFIKNWYNRQDVESLAALIAEIPKYRGWSHADIIKLGHVKSKEIPKSAIYAYAVGGVAKLKSSFGDNENARSIYDHLMNIDSINKEQNLEKAISAIKTCTVIPPNINPQLFKNREIWAALLPKMGVDDIIPKLHLISQYGLLRSHEFNSWDRNLIKIILDRILDKTNLANSKINPATIFLEHQRYQYEPKLKQQIAEKKNRKIKRPPQINPEYVLALEKSMTMAFENISTTTLHFTIVVDNFKLTTKSCTYKPFVSAPFAASILTLMLKKTAASVKIFTFKHKQFKLLVGKALDTVQSLAKEITTEANKSSITNTIADFLNPWNIQHKGTDVYVVMANTVRVDQYLDMVDQHYRYNQRKPNLCGLKKAGAIQDHENVIVTSGFDDKLMRLINALSKPVPGN